MRRILLPLLCLVVGLTQAQELVKDINAVPKGQLSAPDQFSQLCKPCGGYVYFLASDDDHGREVWRTDGTTNGTILVKDVVEGPADGVTDATITQAVCKGSTLYFRGDRFYKSDGTTAGTTLLFGNTDGIATVFQNDLYYYSVPNLSRFDGAGGFQIADIQPVPGATSVEGIHFKADGDMMYLHIAHRGGEGEIVATEIWASDGVTTTLVYTSTEIIENFEVLDGILYFVGYDSDNGHEWWTSNGTPVGTDLLVDANPGPGDSQSFSNYILADQFIFTTQVPEATWKSQGTPATTSIAINDFSPYYFKEFHGKLYMSAYGPSGWFLARTELDLTNYQEFVPDAGTSLAGLITVANDKLLYSYEDPTNGVELFTVGDVSGNAVLSLVKDINTGSNGSNPRSFAELPSFSVFIAEDASHGFEFWVTDGTDAGTFLLKDIGEGTPSAQFSDIYAYNKKLYFLAKSSLADKREVWMSDGTEAGTSIIYDDPDLHKGTFFGVNQFVVTSTSDGFVKVDVDTEDNIALNLPATYNNYAEPEFQPSLAIGNLGLFNTSAAPTPQESVGVELWAVDVSTNDITLVKDINEGPEGSNAYDRYGAYKGLGAVLGSMAVFPAMSVDGNEPWVSDGTEEGTMMLANINGNGSSDPRSFVAMGSNIFFVASSDAAGREIWMTDGTQPGTMILKDVRPGFVSGIVEEELAVYNDILLFVASTDGSPGKLWMSDGTEEGTEPYDLLPDGWTKVQGLFSSGNYFFFSAEHPDHGRELWSSDGTPEGTTMIELEPGAAGGISENFLNDNGTLYFTANSKIWRTQGDFLSTALLGEVTQSVDNLYLTDDYICFVLDDESVGKELFRMDLNGPVGQLIMFNGFTGLRPGQEYDFSVLASSDLPVDLESSDPSVIEISGNKLIVHKAGTVTFTATQDGDVDFKPATATLEVVINLIPQTITFAPLSNKTVLDLPFNAGASIDSDQPLTYESSDPTIAEISATGEITIKKTGTVIITVSQPGSDSYAAALPVARSFTIGKVAQTITFNELPTRTFGDAPFALTAATTSGLTVTYTAEGGKVSISGSTATILSAGQATIIANQAGNDVYSAATGVTRVFCINPAKPTVNQTGIGEQITLTSTSTTNVWKRNDVTLSFTGKTFTVTEAGVYKAAGTAEGCQGEFSDGVNVVITGLEDLSNDGIEVFPNPAEKNLTIRCQPQSHIRIVDVTGKEQINEVTWASESVIDVSSFAAGVYVIAIRYDSQTHYSKFLKR